MAFLYGSSQYASVTQHSEYARVCLDRVLNINWVLYMLGYKLGSIYAEYCRVLNMQELHRLLNMPQYGWICLNRAWVCLNVSEFSIIDSFVNMYHTIHSATSLYKLISTYWQIIIVFNYFCKKLQLKSLRGFWICVRF